MLGKTFKVINVSHHHGHMNPCPQVPCVYPLDNIVNIAGLFSSLLSSPSVSGLTFVDSAFWGAFNLSCSKVSETAALLSV